jgi:hypothetical protein
MTKHEVDVIGGLNMTDQISNEAYKQIMIAAQDENEVGDVLDKISAEIEELKLSFFDNERTIDAVLSIIDKYRKEQE